MPAVTARTITVTLRFLARYGEVVGRESCVLTLSLPATVADALVAVREILPAAVQLPAKPLCAVNFRQVRLETAVADGDEIALLPPVAGG
jgi:molybdopterin converting factor small subunit